MSPLGRFLARWVALAVLALVIGGSIGTIYALNFKEPVMVADGRERDEWPPAAPVLASPAHKAVLDTNAPLVEWEVPRDIGNGNLMYVVEFAHDKDFSLGLERMYANIYEPRFQVPDAEAFPPGVTVYWRVYAVDAGLNQGPYSFVWSFTPLGLPSPRADAAIDVGVALPES